jgi:hypothetical protein
MSNPISYKRRIELAKRFINRINLRNDVELYIAEIAYGINGYKFEITESNNDKHLQIKAEIPLWHKENAINMVCKQLLPDTWTSFCWIDMDIIFENEHWALDTLNILNNPRPTYVQLFSHAVDLDYSEKPMTIFQSFAYQSMLKKQHATTLKGFDYWHPGYAWGMNRAAYKITNGLYDMSIVGSGDYIMAMSLIGKGHLSIDQRSSTEYKNNIKKYQQKIQDGNVQLICVNGVIRHEYHGSKVNRKYIQRNDIIIKNCYNPTKHIKYREDGLIVPTDDCPKEMIDEIIKYFKERNEDECEILQLV